MTAPSNLSEKLVTALRAGLNSTESESRSAMIDVLALLADPADFEPILQKIYNNILTGMLQPETVTDTLYVINFLLGTNYIVSDIIQDGEC